MVKEQFGLDYQTSGKAYSVSERSDFHISAGNVGGFLFDVGALTHLLPRDKANGRIFDRAVKRMLDDCERNINNMICNYRYKMRESLRTLCAEFADEISQKSDELNQLFSHVEKGHAIESRNQNQATAKYTQLIRRFDELFAGSPPTGSGR